MLPSLLRVSLALLLASTAVFAAETSRTKAPSAPVRALLVTGGCCHDYDFQAKAFMDGAKAYGQIEWTIVNDGGKGTRAQISLYDNPDWAKPYDVIVHNECFADTTDEVYLRKITAAHRAGKPAVVIHCAMHSYRAATVDDWREFLGVTSKRHDHQSNYPVRVLAPNHPALRDLPADWVTPKDELYIIDRVWPNTTVLATSKSEKDGKEHAVIWTNNYHGTRVFGTTYGHSNATWQDPVFVRLVTRGLLWAAGR